MEVRTAEFMVRVALPEMLPEMAVMVTAPRARPMARPVLPTVAKAGFEEVQATSVVKLKLVPSEKAPVAVNCWLIPTGMVGFAGVTEIDDRVAEFPVRVVLPEMLPEVAVMVVVPVARTVARPVVLIVAATGFKESQVTSGVISKLVPSEKAPVAVNCWVTPTGMLGFAGVTEMDDRVAELPVRVVLPEIVPEEAVMVAVPVARTVARPVLLIVTTAGFEETQVTSVLILKLVPSVKVAVAANCWVMPTGMLGFTGVTEMDDRVAEYTLRMVSPLEPKVE